MENHGENTAPNIGILPCVFITGYKIYRICREPAKSKIGKRENTEGKQ